MANFVLASYAKHSKNTHDPILFNKYLCNRNALLNYNNLCKPFKKSTDAHCDAPTLIQTYECTSKENEWENERMRVQRWPRTWTFCALVSLHIEKIKIKCLPAFAQQQKLELLTKRAVVQWKREQAQLREIFNGLWVGGCICVCLCGCIFNGKCIIFVISLALSLSLYGYDVTLVINWGK